MSSIKSLTQKIEAEQIRKLQELSSNASGGQSAGEFLSFGGAPGLNGRISPSGASESDFESLVFGKKEAPVNDGFAWQSSTNTNGSSALAPRAKSPPIITGAQKFAWSSPSPTIPSAPTTGTFAPSPAQPAQANTFSTLRPAAPPSNTMAPLQPSTSGGFGSTMAFRSPSAPPTQPQSSGSIDWSAVTRPAPAPVLPFSAAPIAPKPNLSFPSPPAPMNQMSGLNLGGSGGFGGSNGNTGTGIRKGGGIQLTNFGAMAPTSTPKPAPAPAQPLPGTFNMGAGMKKAEEKQGLDKWESLI